MIRSTLCKLLLFVSVLWLSCTDVIHAAEVYDVPGNSSFKSYMDYHAITNKKSKQYKLQQQCVTDANGLRVYDGYYTIAVGTGFGAGVGDYLDVKLSTGTLLHCIVGDLKQNAHTGSDNIQVSHNGNVIEFIVDTDTLNKEARTRGNISAISGFEGDVESVTVLGGTVRLGDTQPEPKEVVVDDTNYEYFIVSKCSTPMVNGETIYMIEYAFRDDFNSILCSKDFYDSVTVGDVVTELE